MRYDIRLEDEAGKVTTEFSSSNAENAISKFNDIYTELRRLQCVVHDTESRTPTQSIEFVRRSGVCRYYLAMAP